MAKKGILGGFKLKLLSEVSNGLIIPTGNDVHHTKEETISSFVKPKPTLKVQSPFLERLSVDAKAFTPMTNIVPTIEDVAVPDEKLKFKGLSRRARQIATPQEIDLLEYGALQTKQERISYLAIRGWSLKIEQRGNGLYYYATKYFERKKKRIYVCSINQGM